MGRPSPRLVLEDAGEHIEAQAIGLIGRSVTEGTLPEDVAFPGETLVHAQRRHMAMGWLHLIHDDPITARQKLERRTFINGSERIALWQDAWLARANFLLGEWNQALRAVEVGLARAEQFGLRFLEPLLLWNGTQISISQNNPDLARHYLSRLSLDQDSFLIQSIPSGMCRLWVSTHRNEMPGALLAGNALMNLRATTDFDQPGFWPWQDVHATNLIRTGHIEQAEELVEGYMDRLRGSSITSVKAKMKVPEAMLRIHHGDVKQGFALFDEALEMLEPLPLPFYRSRILLEYGQALRRQGQRRRADEIFARASALFQDMGASALVTLANRERRVGGLGPRSSEVGGLTPQEYEIARLVADGLSNRGVADELFLSPKTVEYHLTRVYRKLNIRARTELGDALRAYRRT